MTTKLFGDPLALNPVYRQVPAWVPDERDVRNLKVGDMAPTCWGKMQEVTSIYACKPDINGNWFVCYHCKDGNLPGSTISGSMKQGELVRTLPLTGLFNSAECDRIEWEMNQQINP